MPNVMIKKEKTGFLSFYIAKRDVEAQVKTIEFDSPDRWGGRFDLVDGQSFFIEPLSTPPKMPITLRAKRV